MLFVAVGSSIGNKRPISHFLISFFFFLALVLEARKMKKKTSSWQAVLVLHLRLFTDDRSMAAGRTDGRLVLPSGVVNNDFGKVNSSLFLFRSSYSELTYRIFKINRLVMKSVWIDELLTPSETRSSSTREKKKKKGIAFQRHYCLPAA